MTRETLTFPFVIIAVSCATEPSCATTVYFSNFNPIGAEFRDMNGSLLSAGSSVSGDGAVLQLGYYSGATTMNPFSGNWTAISGPGTGYISTIGDSKGNLPPGTFSLAYQFKDGSSSMPAVGTPLAIRFYDSTSLATATYFNCVSNTGGTWNWAGGLPEPTLNLTFSTSAPTQIWQGGPTSAFRTTIAIPEPSSVLLTVLGTGLLFKRRRRT